MKLGSKYSKKISLGETTNTISVLFLIIVGIILAASRLAG